MVRWGLEKGISRGTGPKQKGTAEALGEHEELGCTQSR